MVELVDTQILLFVVSFCLIRDKLSEIIYIYIQTIVIMFIQLCEVRGNY